MSGIERRDLARDNGWRLSANCATADPELFFPDTGKSARLGKTICEACIVREDCLADALSDPPEYGVRAGYTPREPQELRMDAGLTRVAEMEEKYQQARALRDEGKPLAEIAQRIGYASHAGVRFLLERYAEEAS